MNKEERNEYRDDMNRVAKDSAWTLWRFLPLGLLIVVLLTFLGWGLKSAGIIGKDIDREVVQHSRQYTESKQAKLQNLYTEYTNLQTKAAQAEAGGQEKVANAVKVQQRAILAQMKREATNIPNSELPSEVHRLIR